MAILGGEIENVTGFELPGGEGSRSLIKIRENETDFGKVSEKSGTSRKRAVSWEQNEHETGYMSAEKHIFIRLLYQIRIKNQTIFIAIAVRNI